jgi:hypothetical protein
LRILEIQQRPHFGHAAALADRGDIRIGRELGAIGAANQGPFRPGGHAHQQQDKQEFLHDLFLPVELARSIDAVPTSLQTMPRLFNAAILSAS